MSPKDAAERILKAIKKQKREVILTNAGKAVVNINKFFPKLTDKIVSKSIG